MSKTPPPKMPGTARKLRAASASRKATLKVSTGAGKAEKAERRREAWVMAAIAVLFVLNVLIYLSRHWHLTGANDARAGRPAAPQVIVD